MMKIVDYDLLANTRNVPLEEIVSNRIKQGWQPYGSPYLDRNGVEKQAVVLHEEPKTEAITPNLTSKSQHPKPKKKEVKNED